ncbi:MAG: DUF4352 domain-containing protein [Chloroflexota bacterium]
MVGCASSSPHAQATIDAQSTEIALLKSSNAVSPTAVPSPSVTQVVATPTPVPTATPRPSPTVQPTSRGVSATATPWQSAQINTGGRAAVVGVIGSAGRLGLSTPKSGKEYLVLVVGIKNLSSKRVSYNSWDFKIKDSNGNIQGEAIVFGLGDDVPELGSGELAPDGYVGGALVFEVPKGDQHLALIWDPCQFEFLDACPEKEIRLPGTWPNLED